MFSRSSPFRETSKQSDQATAVRCDKCYGKEKHRLLWEPRAENLTQSWEEYSAIKEVSLEEVTPELVLEDSTQISLFLSLLKVKIDHNDGDGEVVAMVYGLW